MVLCTSLGQGSLIPDQPNTDLVRNQGTISKGHSYIGVRVPHFWSVQVGPGQESGTLSQRYSGRQWVKGPSLLIRFDGSLIPDQLPWGSGQESGTYGIWNFLPFLAYERPTQKIFTLSYSLRYTLSCSDMLLACVPLQMSRKLKKWGVSLFPDEYRHISRFYKGFLLPLASWKKL